MIARTVKIQLAIFLVLTLIASLLIVFTYVRVPTLLGYGQMVLKADFVTSGGIYPNANVTYQGFTIGTVTDVEVAPGGVRATMSVDEDHAPPANSRAEVHSVSALGEQYIDFVPDPAPAPAMADGDVVPVSRTSVPERIADVLQDTQNLLASVDQNNLTTVLDEGADAFNGIGPDLGNLLDDVTAFTAVADQNYQPTSDLINQFPRLLDSQRASSEGIRSWTASLDSFTAELKKSDGALRGTLEAVPPAANRLDAFVQDLSASAPTFLNTSNTVAELAEAYNAPIEQVLVVYPAIIAQNLILNPRGEETTTRFNLMTTANTQQCNVGWVDPGKPGGPRPATELSDLPLPADTYCKLPQDEQAVTRGARNIPCFEPGSPEGRRAATVAQCRGNGFAPGTQNGTTKITDPLGVGGTEIPFMQGEGPVVGGAAGPDAAPMNNPLTVVGAPSSAPAPAPEELTWQNLMLAQTAAP